MAASHFDAIVIGGGINGLSALWHFGELGLKRIALFDQFQVGHDRGSSHGVSRITRSTYVDADYVRLMQVVHGQTWPRLESRAGKKFIHQTPGCFFGTAGEKFESYANAVATGGADVERLDPAEGRKRFPTFRFPDAAGVLHDHTAGVIAAQQAVQAIFALCQEHHAAFFEGTKVLSIDPSRDPIRIDSSSGAMTAEKLVITAGGWIRELCPFLSPAIQVARQTVGYFKLEGAADEHRLPNFPVWVYLDDRPDRYFYGLPEFGREGVKIARHLTVGKDDDPNELPGTVADSEIEILRQFVAEQFVAAIRELAGTERCLYTVTPNEDFIIDLHPQNPNIAIGSACSGHGFKFGPLTGQALVELVTSGRTTIPEFEQVRCRFTIASVMASRSSHEA